MSKKKSRKARLAEKKKTRGKDARRRENDDEVNGVRAVRGKSSKTSQQKVDVADDRFAGLFESEKFALDPTDPRFRETKAADVHRGGTRAAAWREEPRDSPGEEEGETRAERAKKTRKKRRRGRRERRGRRRVARDGQGLKRKSEAAARASGDRKRR